MDEKTSPALKRVAKAFLKANLEIRAQPAGGFMAQCPAHLDSNPSLSIQWKPENGEYGSGVVFNCFAQQCSTDDIVRELGLTLADLFDYRPGEKEDPTAKEGKASGDRWTNIREAWNRERDNSWIVYPLVDRARATTLYAPAGKGKSFISLEIAAALAAGRDVLGQPLKRANVVYWDMENDEGLWIDRLKAMHFTPDDLDGHLFYYSFPETPGGLDTEKGGADLVAEAEKHKAVLVVVDTYATNTDGDEDKSDTARGFAKYVVAPLKARGIACLRLDHTGKDEAKGERGTSAKRGDVDYSWQMMETSKNHFTLKNQKDRTGRSPEEFAIVRKDEPWLHHDVTDDLLSGMLDPVDKIIRDMDAAGLPNDASRKTARDAGIQGTDKNIQEAVKRRKARDSGDPSQG